MRRTDGARSSEGCIVRTSPVQIWLELLQARRIRTGLTCQILGLETILSNRLNHTNNFDFLRFAAAIFVVWGHAYNLVGLPAPQLWGKAIHSIGLAIFFSISGFLITESWLRTSSFKRFFWKRALRIFPALATCILLSALVLGPFTTRLDWGEYFTHSQFFRYFYNIFLYIHLRLPGVFDGNLRASVNDSLWSLPVEFICYLSLAAVGLTVRHKLRTTVILAIPIMMAVSIYLSFAYSGPRIVYYNIDARQALSLFPYFFIGSLFCLLQKHLTFRADITCALAAAMFLPALFGNQMASTLAVWLAMPYVCLTFGLSNTRTISDWGARFGDMSYGIYLYSMPVQQVINYLAGGTASLSTMLLGSVFGSIACGWLSWRLIEKPALTWKNALSRARTYERAEVTLMKPNRPKHAA